MNKNNLDDPIVKIPFIGEAQAGKFARLGVETVEQLLEFLPRDLLDLSNPSPISKISAKFGEKIILLVRVEDISVIRTLRRHLWMVQAKLRDGTGEIAVHWFNQPYLRNFFKKDKKYLLYGEYAYDFQTRKTVISNPEIFSQSGIFPIYPQTRNLTSKQISRAVKSALDAGYRLPDLIPDTKNNQITQQIHFPTSVKEYSRARQLFIFQKLIIFILANLYLKKESENSPAFRINPDQEFVRKFVASLPFMLTVDQQKVIGEILNDFKKSSPMNRLIQGDVGSGKTIIALVTALLTIRSGHRVAWLAPTQILAAQHYETVQKFVKFVKFIKLKTELVTSATAKKVKSKNEKVKITSNNLKSNTQYEIRNTKYAEPDLLIGTHALLQKDIKIDKLGLVIVDEQHRFGVEQRGTLLNKTLNSKSETLNKIKNSKAKKTSSSDTKYAIRNTQYERIPHLLSLSATPIPRTLAHVIFGNLDISTIETKPAGRISPKTYLVPEAKRADSYKFIDSLIAKGQQVFVICPLISDYARVRPSQSLQGSDPRIEISLFEQERTERKTVENEVAKLQKGPLSHRKIVALHGKMKPAEKEKIMSEMRDGKIDILVSTSVVEVGVDIPKATAMIIENAECFGLSQLHQFRGRIGRNNLQSYCLLFSNNLDNEKTRERLKTFIQNHDGFKLAEMDLRQRGPGVILGTTQSGFGRLNPLWFENTKILADASAKARDLLLKLDRLPDLKEKVLSELQTEHLE